KRRRRRRRERIRVEIRDERRRRLDAEPPDELARERRHRAHGVRVPDGRACGSTADRFEEPAQRRAVQPRRGLPVAVHLEHDLRRYARERSSGQRRGRLVRALRDDDVRAKGAQLARDLEGQLQIRGRRAGTEEPETPVGSLPGREHAEIELDGERVPFACDLGIKRQPVSRAADEENARSHDDAAAIRACSMRANTDSRSKARTESAAAARSLSRSSSSEKKRRTAPASASTSPAETSRPFSPSRTISPTPPTAVAITGVPAASASTTVCGKFSQLDERIDASAAR